MSDPERFRPHYQGTNVEELPWFNADPDEDVLGLFERVFAEQDGPSRFLDLGAGPAVHGIWLAQRGHHVVAVDGVPEARDMALALAKKHGTKLEYVVGDALAFESAEPFDAVFDRGFLHTLPESERAAWLRTVVRALRPHGYLILKCFDQRRDREMGPDGMSALEVVTSLGDPDRDGLILLSLTRASFTGDLTPHPTWTVFARKGA